MSRAQKKNKNKTIAKSKISMKKKKRRLHKDPTFIPSTVSYTFVTEHEFQKFLDHDRFCHSQLPE